jgi:hypothetical protein
MNNLLGSIFALGAGVFLIIASILDWNWFFEHYKARLFVKLLGRTGARVFYTINEQI